MAFGRSYEIRPASLYPIPAVAEQCSSTDCRACGDFAAQTLLAEVATALGDTSALAVRMALSTSSVIATVECVVETLTYHASPIVCRLNISSGIGLELSPQREARGQARQADRRFTTRGPGRPMHYKAALMMRTSVAKDVSMPQKACCARLSPTRFYSWNLRSLETGLHFDAQAPKAGINKESVEVRSE
nr:hypothetical protein CFP56_36476 [Quercus suber]